MFDLFLEKGALRSYWESIYLDDIDERYLGYTDLYDHL
jgi:hypothetical protein